jgi:hypothetical protein
MPRAPLLLSMLAALMGAAGVVLAAAAEHAGGGDRARTAAVFLILHAAAALGIAAHARVSQFPRGLLAAGFLMVAGASLFAGISRHAPSTAEGSFPSLPRLAARRRSWRGSLLRLRSGPGLRRRPEEAPPPLLQGLV